MTATEPPGASAALLVTHLAAEQPNASPEEGPALTPPAAASFLQRHRWLIGGAALSVLLIALVWLASLPTGADAPARTVGEGARLAASAEVADVEVLIVSKRGALSVQVAYRSPKGWLGAPLPAAPSNAVAAWAGTNGDGPIPPLAVVYGRAPGSSVEVEWADGRRTMVRATSDGVYVAARDRYVESVRVHFFDAAGTSVLTIEGP